MKNSIYSNGSITHLNSTNYSLPYVNLTSRKNLICTIKESFIVIKNNR